MQNSDDWTTMHSTFIGTGLKAGRVSGLQPYMQMHFCELNAVAPHQ